LPNKRRAANRKRAIEDMERGWCMFGETASHRI
jgi:hypothetical protein